MIYKRIQEKSMCGEPDLYTHLNSVKPKGEFRELTDNSME